MKKAKKVEYLEDMHYSTLTAIDSDKKLVDELKAGKFFIKGLEYESKGKNDRARKYFK